ncbi:MAG: hypothetical protein GY796_10355, partial [Chloroflexi bacterium]|nr:hypothetical protein [Chloroflexota bacterium]
DGSTAVISVTLNQPHPYLDIAADYLTNDGTAADGEDYTAVSGTLTFTAGITQASFTIPITDDLFVETDETLTVSLTSPVNAAVGVTSTATLTILDNDKTLPPQTYFLYLPVVMSIPNTPVDFPAIHIGDAIPGRPLNMVGEVFYTKTITIPAALPAGGHYYLSASDNITTAAVVDDALVILLNGTEAFMNDYTINNNIPIATLVELPQATMQGLAGQTIIIEYRDVHGQYVGASEMWLIWRDG